MCQLAEVTDASVCLIKSVPATVDSSQIPMHLNLSIFAFYDLELTVVTCQIVVYFIEVPVPWRLARAPPDLYLSLPER